MNRTRERTARSTVLKLQLLVVSSLLIPSSLPAVEPEQLVGHWLGTLTSDAFPEGLTGTLDAWIEDDTLKGVIANRFGVAMLGDIKLAEEGLAISYVSPLGVGNMNGQMIDGNRIEFEWKLMDLTGTGEADRTDPATVEPIALESLAGRYEAQATGPMIPGSVPMTLTIAAGDDGLEGALEAPMGEFAIAHSWIHHHRLILQVRNDEDMEGIVVGSKTDDQIEVFWSIGITGGEAIFSKNGAAAEEALPDPEDESSSP